MQSSLYLFKFGAAFLDIAITLALQLASLCFISWCLQCILGQQWQLFGRAALFAAFAISTIAVVVYYARQEASPLQATIGRRQFALFAKHDSKRANYFRIAFTPLAMLFVIQALVGPINQVVVFLSLAAMAAVEAAVLDMGAGVPPAWKQATEPVVRGQFDISAEPDHDLCALDTARGKIGIRWYGGRHAKAAVILVGGCGVGFGSPASGLYANLARALKLQGIASLWLKLRNAACPFETTHDLRAVIQHLSARGFINIAVIGHSANGATAITAANFQPEVSAVVTLASQNAYTDMVSTLAPRPLLVVHGTKDRALPRQCALDIYNRAGTGKQLVLLPAGHSLREASADLFDLLVKWVPAALCQPRVKAYVSIGRGGASPSRAW